MAFGNDRVSEVLKELSVQFQLKIKIGHLFVNAET